VPAARWLPIEAALRSAVEGRYDVEAAVEKWRRGARPRSRRRPLLPPRVAFDSLSSAASTVIEVRAEDEPGLAFLIANVLRAHGLNIGFAKIATDKSHALDVFYVTGAEGGKVDDVERARVGAALVAALDPRRAVHS
jgi:[protein-PII] uridylyltransferase